MSVRHILAITRKEINHILRNRGTFFLVLLTPLLVLLLMAYALTVEFENIPVAVLDYDRSAESRQFISRITAGDDLDLYAQVDSIDDIETMLLKGQIKAALVIGATFSDDLITMRGIPIQVIIDGTEPESGTYALDNIAKRAEEIVSELLSEEFQRMNISEEMLNPIDLRIRAWFNPGLKPRVALIPGLISMILGFPAMSVALSIAREREHGTMEQLLATPVSKTDLLLGKIIPYILVGLFNVIFIPIFSMWWFDIPFNGNFLVFFMLSALFMFAILSLGMILGVFIRTQAASLALSFLVIFFPGFFLTGIFFPIAAMPEVMRMEGIFLPGTHYASITRGVFLQGVGLEVLWPNALFLIFLGVVFTAVSVLFFKKKIG
ncbi:MAG: ABC transporter permease [Anaerolineaceae bacterium]|nr:ABC transporter permease [Anaerolineaceae bacterium]